MHAFTFQTTRSVISEVGATSKVGEIMGRRSCKKVAFITDKIILEHGLADAALAGLKAEGIEAWIFDDVVADPPETMILSAVEAARAAGVDGVVSLSLIHI